MVNHRSMYLCVSQVLYPNSLAPFLPSAPVSSGSGIFITPGICNPDTPYITHRIANQNYGFPQVFLLIEKSLRLLPILSVLQVAFWVTRVMSVSDDVHISVLVSFKYKVTGYLVENVTNSGRNSSISIGHFVVWHNTHITACPEIRHFDEHFLI